MRNISILTCAAALAAFATGCGDGGGGDDGLKNVGQACETADDCYQDIDHDLLSGDVVCLTEVQDGYCTHLCETDEDCCAVEGECDYDIDLEVVCSPFQATGQKFCFISCEGEGQDDEYCQTWAHPDFICRSTGGGAQNRKVCVPPGT